MPPLFHIAGLSYRRSEGTPFALDVENFSVPEGGIVAIIGGSGSGKTTLINLLGGLERATLGVIELCLRGETYRFGSHSSDGDFPFRQVGRVFQQGHLLPSSTVAANIAVGARAAGVDYTRATLEHAIVQAGLDPSFLDRRAWQLSGGEAQRVSIARAMVGEPALIFADEPTSNADPDLADQLMRVFRDWVEEDGAQTKRTILWVTHNYQLAADHADHVIVLKMQADAASERKAGVIYGEKEPRRNPERTEALHEWVGVDGSGASGWLSTEARATVHEKPDKSLEAKLAAGELYSRRAGASVFEELQPVTSIGVSGKNAGSLLARWHAFQPRNLLARSILAGLLVLVALGGFTIREDHFARQFDNPAFSNVVVSGTPKSDYALTSATLAALKECPWLNGQASKAVQACGSEAPTWPRHTERLTIGLPDEFGLCDNYRGSTSGLMEAQAMLVDRREPALTAMMISDAGHRSVSSTFSGGQSSDLNIVVSDIFASDFLELGPDDADAIETLCVDIGNEVIPVAFGGVSSDLPADRYYFYDALMPLEAYETIRGKISAYHQASLYFTADELEPLKNFLIEESKSREKEGFVYDAGVLSKFSDAVALNKLLAGVTTFIVVLVFLANLLSLAATYSGVIEQNARGIAMQLSLGMPVKVIRSFLTRHMLVIWSVGSVITVLVCLAGVAALWSLEAIDSRTSWLLTEMILVTPAATLLISLAAIWIAIWRWAKSVHSDLAETLQAGN